MRGSAAAAAWAAVAILGSTACFFRGRLPAVELYRLAPPDTTELATSAVTGPVLDGALAVGRYATPGVYGTRGIVYRVGETGYGSYPNREWAIPLGEMVGMRTAEILRHMPVTRDGAVYDPPSRRQFQYVWRGVVHRFEEVNRGNSVFAAVSLEARLVRAADDSVIWIGTRSLERPVPGGTMSGIIDTLSALSTEVIRRLIDDVNKAAPTLTAPTTQRQ